MQAGLWYRDGGLVYRLKHWRWDKGKELFENETTVRIEGKDSELLAEELLDYLRTKEQP